MSKHLSEEILSNEQIAPGIFRMKVKSDYISCRALPGQFVNVKCCEGINAFLRRPISICSVEREKGYFDIVFQVKGTGTKYLSLSNAGGRLDVIGPLGNSFSMADQYGRIAVIGGGIGIFPLLFLLEEHRALHKTAYIGFRSKEFAVLTQEFQKAAREVIITTDDGSYGNKGVVTDMLRQGLKMNEFDIIYSCGPLPMLKEVVKIASENGIKCQVSLEQRMGCGIGACLVCACKTRLDEGWQYSHVCKDGPVFWSDEIIIED